MKSKGKSMGQHKKNKNRDPNDFYPTDPKFVEALLRQVKFKGIILEPAAGEGHVSIVLKKHSYTVCSYDLINHGYCESNVNFLDRTKPIDNIVTNPPYKLGIEFIEKAISLANNKIAFLMKLNFAETQGRYEFFKKHPPNKIILISNRMGDSQFAHAWFIWDNKNKATHTEFVWEMAT